MGQLIPHWQLVLANFSGVIYTLGVIFAITTLNLYYTCPAIYETSGCFWPAVCAIIILSEIAINLVLFHFFNKRNQISYWIVKSSTLLPNYNSTSVRENNRYTTVEMPSEESAQVRIACSVDTPSSVIGHINRRGINPYQQFEDESSGSLEQENDFINGSVVRDHKKEPKISNHYQHFSKNNRLSASTDGVYRVLDSESSLNSAESNHNSAVTQTSTNTVSEIIPSTHYESSTTNKFCIDCNKITPKRCHHCPICRICVLRKDHHCFMTGGCVGLANQRYFIVFLFWAALGAGLGSVFNFLYLNRFVISWYPFGWVYYLGPVAMIRWIIGLEQFFNMILAVMFSLSAASCFSAFAFFFAQFFYTLQGYTQYDYHVSRLRDHLESDGETWGERLALVFGARWLINFLLPQFWLPNLMSPKVARNIFVSISKDL